MQMQHGTVTAVSATSISVKSDDGFTATYVVDADTEVNRDGAIADIKADADVMVMGLVDGSTVTAQRVVDTAAFGERGDHDGDGPKSGRSLPERLRLRHPLDRDPRVAPVAGVSPVRGQSTGSGSCIGSSTAQIIGICSGIRAQATRALVDAMPSSDVALSANRRLDGHTASSTTALAGPAQRRRVTRP